MPQHLTPSMSSAQLLTRPALTMAAPCRGGTVVSPYLLSPQHSPPSVSRAHANCSYPPGLTLTMTGGRCCPPVAHAGATHVPTNIDSTKPNLIILSLPTHA